MKKLLTLAILIGIPAVSFALDLNNAVTTNLTGNVVEPTLTRSQGGTLSITNNGYTFTPTSITPTNINGILPWAVIRDTTQPYTNNWAVSNGDGAALTSLTNYHTTYNNWGITNYYNVRPVAGNCNVQSSFTVNSWVMDAGCNAYGHGGQKNVTVTSGGIFQTGGSSVLYGDAGGRHIAFTFGAVEGIIHTIGTLSHRGVSAGGTLITGSGGVTKSGSGLYKMTAGGTSAASADTLFGVVNGNTGPFTINEGTVRAESTSVNALGSGAATLVMNGGRLELAGGAVAINYARNVTVKGSSTIVSDIFTNAVPGITYTLGTLAISNQTLTVAGGTNVNSGVAGLTFSGATTLTGSPTFNVTNPAAGGTTVLTLSGDVGGSYGITKTGNGTLALSGTNTFTGDMTVEAGLLAITGSGTTQAIADTTDVRISGSAMVQIEAGVNEFVDEIVIDGKLLVEGSWGNEGSGADHVDAVHFSGTGILTALNGMPQGTVIIVR